MPKVSNNPELYFIEASQAAPFVETATRLGLPVRELAIQAGMPLDTVRSKQGVIGEHSLWRFLEYASNMVPEENLGYRTALEHPLTNAAQLGGLRMRLADSLEQILQNFIHDVKTESTGARYALRPGNGYTWFHREPVFRDSAASWQAESYVITFIIQIIRLCTDDNWLPEKVRVSSHESPVPVPTEWTSIDFEWGCSATEVRIDSGAIKSQPRFSYEPPDGPLPPNLDKAFLQNCLNGVVDRQIWTRNVGIAKLADELGLSEATCKRRLSEIDTNYTSIVEQRRYRLACQLLSNSNVSLQKIANGLGYKHQSNFTRAFKRVAGESPSEFRQRVATVTHPS